MTRLLCSLSKVLEVSSPTAGSALLGPSQIQSLHSAQELTVRTMSAHGESCDSFPVSVASKLAAIMAGPPVTAPVTRPPLGCPPTGPSTLATPSSNGNSAAKVPALPCSLPSEPHPRGLSVEAAANHPHALHSEALHSPASYAKAWSSPSSSAALAACEASLPVRTNTPVVIPDLVIEPHLRLLLLLVFFFPLVANRKLTSGRNEIMWFVEQT